MSDTDFKNQYVKRFSDSVQNNGEAVVEFKKGLEEGAVPLHLALELLRKYSGDMNTFFEAKPLSEIREGYQGNILGNAISIRCIEYERDGKNRIRCVGALEDKTGKLPFTEFPDGSSRISRGDLVLIVNASVGTYNDHPYLTVSSKVEINVLEKSNLKSVVGEALKIRDLKPDMYDVSIRGTLRVMRSRENVGKDSVTLYSGILNDETGNIAVQSWGTPLDDGIVEVKGASIKQFKEKLYLQVGRGTRITVVSQENGKFETLEQLQDAVSGTATGEGIVLKIFERNIVVSVCSVCQKIVREGNCSNHPEAPLENILRLSFVLDDGYASPLVYAFQKTLESLVDGGKERIKTLIGEGKETEILEEIKEKIALKQIRFSVYGFKGNSGTYMELEEFTLLDDKSIEEGYQKLMEGLK